MCRRFIICLWFITYTPFLNLPCNDPRFYYKPQTLHLGSQDRLQVFICSLPEKFLITRSSAVGSLTCFKICIMWNCFPSCWWMCDHHKAFPGYHRTIRRCFGQNFTTVTSHIAGSSISNTFTPQIKWQKRLRQVLWSRCYITFDACAYMPLWIDQRCLVVWEVYCT